MAGPMLIALAVWLMAAWVFLRSWWRTELERVREQQPCFRCGDASNRAADQLGMMDCPRCGVELFAAQWREPAPPVGSELSRMGLLPALIGGMLLLGLFGAILAIAVASRVTLGGSPVQRFLPFVMRTIGGSRTLANMFDLTICVVLFAGLARLYRARLSRHYDQANRCKRCGHDLRGTPTAEGRGVCGECGTEFFVGAGGTGSGSGEAASES
jgi:ribosomal protein L37AE/L43A